MREGLRPSLVWVGPSALSFVVGWGIEGRWPSLVWGRAFGAHGGDGAVDVGWVLVPDVAFVVVDGVVGEGGAVLVLEGFGAVVFGLVVDVVHQGEKA